MAQPVTVCVPASSSTDWSGPAVKLGALLTAVTAIVNVWAGLVSLPPKAVPPLSTACTVTVASPLAPAAVVYVKVPFGCTCGCALDS